MLTEEQIRAIPEEQLSESDKKYLIKTYCAIEVESEISRQLSAVKREMRNRKRWHWYLGEDAGEVGTEPYRISANFLEKVARVNPPSTPGAAVTRFTGWIYSLYRPPPSVDRLNEGKYAEKQIEGERALPDYGGEPWASGWRRIFKDPLDGACEPLNISRLTVGDVECRGIPDLVFQEETTGHVVIVERKVTRYPIPCDGWPNLRAQLWAYAHADQWRDASRITLVGEIWGLDRAFVYPRGAVRWESNDSHFDETNHRLFELYGGRRNSSLSGK